MCSRPRLLGLALILIVATGCEDEPAKPKIKTRETLHKTTQVVLRLQDALQQGGVLASTKIPVADPLTQDAAAYRTQVARIGGMAVEHAIQLYHAQSIDDPKPLSYDEFMAEIIKKDKPDGIHLAMLPYYQEYAWDEQSQQLVVVDFPARKAEFQKQQDHELGRR